MRLRTVEDVDRYLRSVPTDASKARRWQAVRTATHALLREYGVADWKLWTVDQGAINMTNYGLCWSGSRRTIHYRRRIVNEWWLDTLPATIVHEAAHAIADREFRAQRRGHSAHHGPFWRGQAASMGLFSAQAQNLPTHEVD
jgi:hypothetical protein